jgi:DNA-binding NtrC family response regulator
MADHASGTKQRVLVVDDDPALLRALARVLAAHFEVDLVPGVTSALAKLALTQYAAVVADEKMADGSGRGLLAVVRERYPSCRRILISGYDVPSDRALDPAYDYFLAKPFGLAALVDLLRSG